MHTFTRRRRSRPCRGDSQGSPATQLYLPSPRPPLGQVEDDLMYDQHEKELRPGRSVVEVQHVSIQDVSLETRELYRHQKGNRTFSEGLAAGR